MIRVKDKDTVAVIASKIGYHSFQLERRGRATYL